MKTTSPETFKKSWNRPLLENVAQRIVIFGMKLNNFVFEQRKTNNVVIKTKWLFLEEIREDRKAISEKIS